jgi:uncharacterized protein (UPF0276 family)
VTDIPRLGVGLAYQAQLRDFIERRPDAFDYLEVVPDILWTDLGQNASPRYVDDADGLAFLDRVAAEKPVIPHSIGLSIGSAHLFDRAHVAQIERWYERFHFPWHSDHLSYHLAEHGEDEGDVHLNLTMPVALDRETLALIAERVREVRERIPVPFLLENNVYYFVLSDQDLDEATFLTELSATSGCGLLMDLHNLHVNAENNGTDPYAFLERIDFASVHELHVAGGMMVEGTYVDAHSGPAPDAVWQMLDWVLPRCPQLGGVTFELFGSWYDTLGEEGLLRQLEGMRELWAKHESARAAGVA